MYLMKGKYRFINNGNIAWEEYGELVVGKGCFEAEINLKNKLCEKESISEISRIRLIHESVGKIS